MTQFGTLYHGSAQVSKWAVLVAGISYAFLTFSIMLFEF